MRLGFALLAVLAACGGGDDGGFPVGGGGTDGGFKFPDGGIVADGAPGDGSTATDAMPDEVDAALIMGRVCLAENPRKLNDCAATGAGGLTVRLGTAVATTADDGSFTIVAASGTWRVTGTNIVTSIMALSDYEIPAITRTTYESMITDSLGMGVPNPGEGSIMVQVIRNGAGVDAATASSAPPSAWQPFYDNPNSPTQWNQTVGTGPDGTIWIAGLDVGSASVTVSHAGDQPVNRSGLQIVDGGITFTTVIFP